MRKLFSGIFRKKETSRLQKAHYIRNNIEFYVESDVKLTDDNMEFIAKVVTESLESEYDNIADVIARKIVHGLEDKICASRVNGRDDKKVWKIELSSYPLAFR